MNWLASSAESTYVAPLSRANLAKDRNRSSKAELNSLKLLLSSHILFSKGEPLNKGLELNKGYRGIKDHPQDDSLPLPFKSQFYYRVINF